MKVVEHYLTGRMHMWGIITLSSVLNPVPVSEIRLNWAYRMHYQAAHESAFGKAKQKQVHPNMRSINNSRQVMNPLVSERTDMDHTSPVFLAISCPGRPCHGGQPRHPLLLRRLALAPVLVVNVYFAYLTNYSLE